MYLKDKKYCGFLLMVPPRFFLAIMMIKEIVHVQEYDARKE